jgi:hypothetical protein
MFSIFQKKKERKSQLTINWGRHRRGQRLSIEDCLHTFNWEPVKWGQVTHTHTLQMRTDVYIVPVKWGHHYKYNWVTDTST